jgi:hypothetical protein
MFKALLAVIVQLFMIGAACAAGSLQFTCTGEVIEPAGLARAPISLSVVFSPASKATKVSVDFGQRTVNAPVITQVSHQRVCGRIFPLRARHVSYLQVGPSGAARLQAAGSTLNARARSLEQFHRKMKS